MGNYFSFTKGWASNQKIILLCYISYQKLSGWDYINAS
jgi:hypothetical protein